MTQRKNVSDATARIIDEEIRTLIDRAETTARRVLTENREGLDGVAEALLEFETLSGEEVQAVLEGGSVVRPSEEEYRAEAGRRSSVPSSGGAKVRDEGDEPDPGMEPEPQPGS